MNTCRNTVYGRHLWVLFNVYEEINGVVNGRFPFELFVKRITRLGRKPLLIWRKNQAVCAQAYFSVLKNS